MENHQLWLAVFPPLDADRWHRLRLRAGYALAFSLVLGLGPYGFNYYRLDSAQRPLSPKHLLLKPNGEIGFWLGLFGAVVFLGIFLYPLRKRWAWLQARGNPKNWLDFHVMMGLAAPFIIALHASFKLKGVAGMAFWIMSAVAISGVIGRYLYAQIPRSLNAAELSLQEAREEQVQLTEQLTTQEVFPPASLAPLFRFPREERVRSEPLLLAVATMVLLDVRRLFHVTRLRWRTLGFWGQLTTMGGLATSGNSEVERAVTVARKQAALSKRILFLSRSQRVLHLWHVVHKPFSYSFAVLALIHISVVLLFGVR